MAPEPILNCAKRFVEKLREQGIPIEAVYLFGSWVQGRGTEWSDIDLAVVSPAFQGIFFYDRRKLYPAILAVETAIEPHPYRPEDFNDKDLFVREIVRTGIRIA